MGDDGQSIVVGAGENEHSAVGGDGSNSDPLASSQVIDVIKSENDAREYKYLLLENKFRILLISDSTTEKSAASVNVHVGHSSDPVHVPGIAHFCEHMLFLGTDKYPKEDDFSQFLSQNGGSSNASTGAEHTTYHFDVKSEALFPALDRFAQFFISPLFDQDSTDRELQAIDSEHQKNILSDSRRMYFISKVTSKPGHLYQKFGTGNLETLKTIPEKENIDIRELLLDFHTKYYSANIMTLCVLGKETLEELEAVIVPLFKTVKNTDVVLPSCDDFPYGPDELGVVVEVPSIKEMKKLELKFTIPDLQEHYESKPSEYISHLIGHEGVGSLLSLLKKNVWANALWAGSHRGLRGFEFFVIGMDLCEEGLLHISEIIDMVFMYINMVKKEGPHEWVYEETKMLEKINFQFKDKEQPQGYVTGLSKTMHMYPPVDVLYGPYKLQTFSPELITGILDQLNPENFRYTVTSPTFTDKANLKVKYYDATYSLTKIPAESIEQWKTLKYHPELHIPKKNIFIPSTLEVCVDREVKEVKGVPALIKDTNIMRVWYKADDTFFLPKSSLRIHVASPYAGMTPQHLNLLSMYIRLVRDELVEYAYDAELVGIKYSIDWSWSGFFIAISGFSSNQVLLLRKILDYLGHLEVREDRFNANKDELLESLKNVELSEPYMQMEGLRNYVISEKSWSSEERLECLDDVTVDRLKTYMSEFLSCIYIECLFCGNLLVDEVNEMCGEVEKVLIKERPARPLLPVQHLLPREHKLTKTQDTLYEKRSKLHSNSCVHTYMQVGVQNERSNVLCELFAQIINSPFFQILRTQEQLGYIVFSGLSRSTSVQGLSALIQSDKSPATVEERIESFFKAFEETLTSMPEEQFKDYVDALAVKKLEKPKRLFHETNRYWVEIVIKQYHFRRSEKEVEELRKLTMEDILQFYRTYVSPASQHRKKIVFVVLGKDEKSLTVDGGKQWNPITDNVLGFKVKLPLYSHVLPYNDIPLPLSTSSKL